ncbi:MAG: aminopeptidase [Gaiellaceae bacterium]
MRAQEILEPEQLRRYADAIVKASLGVEAGQTLVAQGEPAHRELLVAIAEAGYRAGATFVEVQIADPLVTRARLKHGKDGALGAVPPWSKQRLRELAKPSGARAAVTGVSEPGYLDGISPRRIGLDYSRAAKETEFYHRAALDMSARWTGAAWPTDYWAAQVYPKLSVARAKRKLAQDLLWFCRLTDDDGKGSAGWLKHTRGLARRAAKLSKLGLIALELRGPGTELNLKLSPGTRWLGGLEETPWGVSIAPNMPTEETFTSPHAPATNGEFACTFPLSFQGRLIEGLRGEFRRGKLIRLDAKKKSDRDFVLNYLDTDPTGSGRRLGEVALVDSTSRIGRRGRTYFNTLLDENAAAHIAFGAGFGGTRVDKPARGLNRSSVHLDVMIGSPELTATGADAKGKAVAVIADGLWQI